MPYRQLLQTVGLESFYTNNSVGFTKALGQFSFEPRMGFQLENKNLESKIITSEDMPLSNDFSNDLRWIRSKIYFELQTQFQKDKWRLDMTIPISMLNYAIRDEPVERKENINTITFEPRLSIIYDLDAFWKLNTAVSVNNQFGTIDKLHYAYILQHYRSIQRIATALPQTIARNVSLGLGYRNPLAALFWNVMYTNTKTDHNLLYETEVSSNGSTTLTAREVHNGKTNQTVSTRISKRLNDIKTDVSFNCSYSLLEYLEILNGDITSIKNGNWSFGQKIGVGFTNWIDVDYQSNWIISSSKVASKSNPSIIQQNHMLDINFNFDGNQSLTVKTTYINNNLFSERSENIFADAIYRYTLKKNKIDFEFHVNNLFDSRNFLTTSVSDFNYIETDFKLRARQFLIKVAFTL